MKVGENVRDLPDNVFSHKLPDTEGKLWSLEELQGNPAVLFFYTYAGSFHCNKEACKFRDEYATFTRAKTPVIGVSSQSPELNGEWKANKRLPFPLLSDEDERLRKAFRVESKLFGIMPGRETYVLSPDGEVLMQFAHLTAAHRHVREAQAIVRKLRPPRDGEGEEEEEEKETG